MHTDLVYEHIETEGAILIDCPDCQGTGNGDEAKYITAQGSIFSQETSCEHCKGSRKFWQYDVASPARFSKDSPVGQKLDLTTAVFFFIPVIMCFLILISMLLGSIAAGLGVSENMLNAAVDAAMTPVVWILAICGIGFVVSLVSFGIGWFVFQKKKPTVTETQTQRAIIADVKAPVLLKQTSA